MVFGSADDSNEMNIKKEIHKIDLRQKDAANKLKEIRDRIARFLRIVDKIAEVCKVKKIKPKIQCSNDGIKSYSFDLSSVKDSYLILGNTPNGSHATIIITNGGNITLRDESEKNCFTQTHNCFNSEKRSLRDLLALEDFFSEEKGFKGWVKKGDVITSQKIEEEIEKAKNWDNVNLKKWDKANKSRSNVYTFEKVCNIYDQKQKKTVMKSIPFFQLKLGDNGLECSFGKGRCETINFIEEDATVKLEKLFSKLESYSRTVNYIFNFCENMKIKLRNVNVSKFSENFPDLSVHWYCCLDTFSKSFSQISVADDGCARIHRMDKGFGETDRVYDLFDEGSVSELRQILHDWQVEYADKVEADIYDEIIFSEEK